MYDDNLWRDLEWHILNFDVAESDIKIKVNRFKTRNSREIVSVVRNDKGSSYYKLVELQFILLSSNFSNALSECRFEQILAEVSSLMNLVIQKK